MKKGLYFLLSLIMVLSFYTKGYTKNIIDTSKLKQVKPVSQKEFILLQLNIGLLYATQDMRGIKASEVKYDHINNKFIFDIEVKKEIFDDLTNDQKKDFIRDIVNKIIAPLPQFFYHPVEQILVNPAKNYSDILANYNFRFKKWYMPDGYEPLKFPEQRENEPDESHIKRIEKWQKDSETFSLLATEENEEISLYK
jgi:hypothetical protein